MQRTAELERIANSLINGSLSQAREQARRRTLVSIHDFLHDECGWSHERSLAAARYLKTGQNFQTYCDAK